MRHRKTGGGTKVKGEEELGEVSRRKPSIWCNICGWVHFNCSGFQRVNDYKDFGLSLFKVSGDTETCRSYSGVLSLQQNT